MVDYRQPPLGDPTADGLRADADDPADDLLADEATGETVERRTLEVPPGALAERLDKLLVAVAPEFSRSHLQGLIAAGHVTVDGRIVSVAARRLRPGQQVVVALHPTDESRAFRAEPLPIDVVFEDESVLVVDKPAGRVVHPAAGHWSGTLMNALLAHHAAAATLPRAGIVHRLDKDTSGLMVVGKTLPAVTALVRAIAAREVRREYLAIAHGRFGEANLTIEAPIGRDPRSRVRMGVVAGGRPARTDVRRIATDGDSSALHCTLHTGRTHQIRVHLASRGHPLLADTLYGGRHERGIVRQALHAARLAFDHPVTGQPMAFESRLPDDLAPVWEALVASR
jgi:23S rRNA pseudouridine1911/1915/1917 synthase